MDDDDWMKPDEDAPAAPAEGADAAAPAADGEAPAVSEEGGVETAEFKARKLILYKHWVRPKFLQYNYMYDYRHNYYNDVIDYLDKRQTGVKAEIPRPQTWAERVLRTNARKSYLDQYSAETSTHITRTLRRNVRSSVRSMVEVSTSRF